VDFIRRYIGVLILMIGIVGIVIINWNDLFSDSLPIVEEYSETLLTTEDVYESENTVIVDIKGEVLYPGYYEVSSNLRIGDIINIAGGLTGVADVSTINQAEKIEDEMIIVIPKYEDDSFIVPNDIVKIIVEIKGEVHQPGIYDLSRSARVADLIELAGGLTEEADLSIVNQAAKLSDGEIIIVPSLDNDIDVDEIIKIVVEIKGEVNRPGIYYVYPNTRTNDLIDVAGGLTSNANTESIEMARILTDGESLVIPKTEDSNQENRYIYVEIYGEVLHSGTYYIPESYTMLDLIYEAGGVTIDCDLTKIHWDLVLCLGAKIYIPSYEDLIDVKDDDSLININKVNLETLMTLPGIGQILGQRIIDYRAEYGGFLSIEEIMNVSGIKESVYEQIKELITV